MTDIHLTSSSAQAQPGHASKASWFSAYRRFLVSRQESLALKLAPLVLVGILPPELLSNLIPGLGLLDDAGYFLIGLFVLTQTLIRVNRYR